MNDFQTLAIDSLEFDKENPRLPSNVRGGSEIEMLAYLATKTSIENLMASIGTNGFFSGEAIVAIPHPSKAAKYIVIEGNRRLAALRLLQNPNLANRSSILRAATEARFKPTDIPVFVVDSREATLQYLGFRHISGVQRWDPLAKARYLESLFQVTDGSPQSRYTAVARQIGSTNPTVRRNLDALALYGIIEKEDFYDISDIQEETFQFGTFYTAISNAEIAEFVGIRYEGAPRHPILDISVVERGHLKELVKWMFERDDQGKTVLGESRFIGRLGSVLGDPDSIAALRMGQSLNSAYRLTPGGRFEFVRRMNRAIDELKQANANLYAVESGDEIAQQVVEEAIQIIQFAKERLGL